MIGYMQMPEGFRYRNVFLRGKPVHQEMDPFSLKHPAMDPGKRAKLFSSFDALRGFSFAVLTREQEHLRQMKDAEYGSWDEGEIDPP